MNTNQPRHSNVPQDLHGVPLSPFKSRSRVSTNHRPIQPGNGTFRQEDQYLPTQVSFSQLNNMVPFQRPVPSDASSLRESPNGGVSLSPFVRPPRTLYTPTKSSVHHIDHGQTSPARSANIGVRRTPLLLSSPARPSYSTRMRQLFQDAGLENNSPTPGDKISYPQLPNVSRLQSHLSRLDDSRFGLGTSASTSSISHPCNTDCTATLPSSHQSGTKLSHPVADSSPNGRNVRRDSVLSLSISESWSGDSDYLTAELATRSRNSPNVPPEPRIDDWLSSLAVQDHSPNRKPFPMSPAQLEALSRTSRNRRSSASHSSEYCVQHWGKSEMYNGKEAVQNFESSSDSGHESKTSEVSGGPSLRSLSGQPQGTPTPSSPTLNKTCVNAAQHELPISSGVDNADKLLAEAECDPCGEARLHGTHSMMSFRKAEPVAIVDNISAINQMLHLLKSERGGVPLDVSPLSDNVTVERGRRRYAEPFSTPTRRHHTRFGRSRALTKEKDALLKTQHEDGGITLGLDSAAGETCIRGITH